MRASAHGAKRAESDGTPRRWGGGRMGYVLLCVAIVTEICATTCLKYTNGFTVPGWSLVTVALYAVCFWCLSRALLTVNLSVAYATWCAAGIIVTTIVSVLLFGERLNAGLVVGLILCVVGVVLVNLNATSV